MTNGTKIVSISRRCELAFYRRKFQKIFNVFKDAL